MKLKKALISNVKELKSFFTFYLDDLQSNEYVYSLCKIESSRQGITVYCHLNGTSNFLKLFICSSDDKLISYFTPFEQKMLRNEIDTINNKKCILINILNKRNKGYLCKVSAIGQHGEDICLSTPAEILSKFQESDFSKNDFSYIQSYCTS